MREWLQLFRSQTASATFILLLTFYLLGGGEIFSLMGLALIVASLLIHYSTFGQNSLNDFLLGYDKEDPHKKHHPLVSGKIKPEQAIKVVNVMLFLACLYCIILALHGANPTLALISSFLGYVFGNWYNSGFSKVSLLKPIPITLAFTFIGLYAYFLSAKELTTLAILCTLYVALTMLFQIGIEGELKDYKTKEVNILHKISKDTFATLGVILKIVNLLVGLYIATLLWATLHPVLRITIVMISFLTIVASLFIMRYLFNYGLIVYETCRKCRKYVVRYCALMEILTIYYLLIVLIPEIGLVNVLFMMILGIVYFVAMNKINWGTLVAPMV
ncbi:hypothetical protein DRJ19_02710 [Candidatus Woesearchaeota archaeon]|nr:MAG: hypothetical protein DRJ19_02710 [Candidatus Woesearchaeota archaeon]